MRASEVLQRCLADAFAPMHALRERVLLKAVEALTAGWRLTLIDLARRWPGAERVRAPLKALDRLLSNHHLHAECLSLHAAMARWLLRGPRPLIVIDWSDLKADKSWCLLRAAVPVGGRTLTLLDRVYPGHEQGSPRAERQFLQQLQALMPESVRPILITDAGFRTPWFRAVQALGWSWVGRLRGTTLVKPVEVENRSDQWVLKQGSECSCPWSLREAHHDAFLLARSKRLELLSRFILILALMLPACLTAQACQYPPPPTFREALDEAQASQACSGQEADDTHARLKQAAHAKIVIPAEAGYALQQPNGGSSRGIGCSRQ